jgi:hypothetical protein
MFAFWFVKTLAALSAAAAPILNSSFFFSVFFVWHELMPPPMIRTKSRIAHPAMIRLRLVANA